VIENSKTPKTNSKNGSVIVVGGSAAGFLTAAKVAAGGREVQVLDAKAGLDPAPRSLIVTHHFREQLQEVAASSIVNEIRRFELFTDGRSAEVALRRPDLVRPYRTWGYPWVPLIFVGVTLLLLYQTLISAPRASGRSIGDGSLAGNQPSGQPRPSASASKWNVAAAASSLLNSPINTCSSPPWWALRERLTNEDQGRQPRSPVGCPPHNHLYCVLDIDERLSRSSPAVREP
jgi:hypothetical protein